MGPQCPSGPFRGVVWVYFWSSSRGSHCGALMVVCPASACGAIRMAVKRSRQHDEWANTPKMKWGSPDEAKTLTDGGRTTIMRLNGGPFEEDATPNKANHVTRNTVEVRPAALARRFHRNHSSTLCDSPIDSGAPPLSMSSSRRAPVH